MPSIERMRITSGNGLVEVKVLKGAARTLDTISNSDEGVKMVATADPRPLDNREVRKLQMAKRRP